MSVSPQEKEKLRKKLKKLFKNEGSLKLSSNCTSSHQPNSATINFGENKTPKSDLYSSTNMKKQQKYEKKSEKSLKAAPIQNGFVKAAKIPASESKTTKITNVSLKRDKPKIQKQNNVKTINPKDNVSSNKHSQDNTKISNTGKQSKREKYIKDNDMPRGPTKTKGSENKSPGRPENTKFESHQKTNGTKFKSKQSSSTNINKKQFKKSKKRRSLNSTSSSEAISNKRQKFTKINIQKDAKTNKKQMPLSDESDSSSSQYNNEYDINHMTGCVRGGDFESDNDESDRYSMEEESYSEDDSEEDSLDYRNWMQNEQYSEHYSEEDTTKYNTRMQSENSFESDENSSDTSKQNTVMKKFKENSKTNLREFYHNNLSDSGEENFDSDDFETEGYDSDSFEEEDETYSDYDEDDYEEEEDSYSYTSESDYSTDELDNSTYDYYHKDYKLPDHGQEDLIIHAGTCTKRDLKPEDNVSFDSDIEHPQMIELECQETVKIIQQPQEYDKEELLKLKIKKTNLSLTTFQKKGSKPTDEVDCPKLVPIVDEDGFQLYNPNEKVEDEEGEEEEIEDEEELENYEEESIEEYEDGNMDDVSLGSEYTEIDSQDADSLFSEDINEKYLKRYHDTMDSDDNIEENKWIKKYKADVIDATGYQCENTLKNSTNQPETSINDDIMQIPSVNLFKNVDLKTESNILSTAVIDNNILFSSDSFEKCLSAQSIEAQETEVISTTQEIDLKNDENNTEEAPKVVKPNMQSMLNYNTKFFNAFNSNLVIVLLKDPFYIYGTVRLTLLAGSMEVYGHSLKLNTEVEIFSPRGCSVIKISSLSTTNSTSYESLIGLLKLYETQFALNDLKTIASLYNGETDAVVLLKRNDERKKVVQQYKKFMNENIFPNINYITTDRPLYNSEYLLRCMINTSSQEQKCLRLPQEWEQFKLTSKSRVMLAGGKNVGKSTLLRYLINRHLPQKVLLIDLDIGQPEVFVPQTVSCTIIEQPLLGPGFLLNLQPEISFAIGHTNIAFCAHKYLNAVRSLITYCREQEAFKDIPWLVNTMGYNKGFGLELISVLVQEPLTDVIQLQSSKEINNFESTLQAHVLSNVPHILFSEEYERNKEDIRGNWNYRLHVWPSAVQQEPRYQKEWEMNAKDFRFAMLLARLSEALQGHADWLTDVEPLSASLNDLKIINLMDNTPLLSAEEMEKSLEANLVYLCHYEEDSKPLKCFGIGVVRAIDFHVRLLYLIPALPYTQLKDVNCLAIGEMPLPTSLFTNQGPRVKNVAPFVYNTIAASASRAIKQIYHRPAKFLTGKHKSLD